jgi:hypothetical protein
MISQSKKQSAHKSLSASADLSDGLNLANDPSFSFADFELIHHWTLLTAESMASDKSLQRTMKEALPQLAMKYDFLM